MIAGATGDSTPIFNHVVTVTACARGVKEHGRNQPDRNADALEVHADTNVTKIRRRETLVNITVMEAPDELVGLVLRSEIQAQALATALPFAAAAARTILRRARGRSVEALQSAAHALEVERRDARREPPSTGRSAATSFNASRLQGGRHYGGLPRSLEHRQHRLQPLKTAPTACYRHDAVGHGDCRAHVLTPSGESARPLK